ncbi:MAG: hypothetical protein ABIE94_06890 [archaeon]
MPKKKNISTKEFFREYIWNFGFIQGIWLAAGINPESILFEAFQPLLPTAILVIFLIILPFVLFIMTFFAIKEDFGKIGLLCVFLGLFAGYIVLTNFAVWGTIILIIAYVMFIFRKK